VERFKKFFEVMMLGKELSDPATWKNRQAVLNVLGGLLSFLVWGLAQKGIKLDISEDAYTAIATGIFTLYGIVNGYLTVATSKKVGLGGANDGQN
jgi:hypothetical protein